MNSKQCTKCKKELPATKEYFYVDKHHSDGLKSQCKQCGNEATAKYRKQNLEKCRGYSGRYYRQNQKKCLEAAKQYQKRNREKYTEYHKQYYLKCKYNITIKDYNKLFQKQEGQCAICGKHQSELNKKLRIDHNHDTGEIRGLLCDVCNLRLGVFEKNSEFLTKAKEYLGYES